MKLSNGVGIYRCKRRREGRVEHPISGFSGVCLHPNITSVTHLCKKGRQEFGRGFLLGTLQVGGEGLYARHFVGSTEALNAVGRSLWQEELKAKRACANDHLRTLHFKIYHH